MRSRTPAWPTCTPAIAESHTPFDVFVDVFISRIAPLPQALAIFPVFSI
jgi:hypothetical protein